MLATLCCEIDARKGSDNFVLIASLGIDARKGTENFVLIASLAWQQAVADI